MKNLRTPWLLLLATTLWSSPTKADDLSQTEEPDPNRFSLAARFGFNITAKIRNLGSGGPAFSGVTPPDPGAATPGVNHNYDDGYNRVDSFGNSGGLTWNWGYAKASQIVGDNLVMSRSLPGELTGNFDGDPRLGVELTYARQLDQLGYGYWGVEAAFGFMDLNLHNTAPINSAVLAVDAYSLGGILPPGAGYQGSFAGPGPLISDTPARADTLLSRLDGSALSLRLGPYVEFPLASCVAISFSGGLALLYVDSDFQFQEMATVSGVPTVLRSGAGTHRETLAGGYVGANLSVAVAKSLNLLLGVQYQHVDNFTQRVGDKQAEIDFGKTVFATAGLSFSF